VVTIGKLVSNLFSWLTFS